MSTIYVEALKLEKEEVVIKSTFSSGGKLDGQTITTEKVCDLGDKEIRQKLLLDMIQKIGWSDAEKLIEEAKEAVEIIRDELPFN